MKRSALENIIRASGAIVDDDEIVIIGSQAILGQFPDAPVQLLVSMEADIYPKSDPKKADLVDSAIGEKTATLPKDWQSRLIAVNNENTNGVTGYCLEAHDLAVSKIIAMRPKDLEFVQELVRHDMIEKRTMLHRLKQTDIENSTRRTARGRIKSLFEP